MIIKYKEGSTTEEGKYEVKTQTLQEIGSIRFNPEENLITAFDKEGKGKILPLDKVIEVKDLTPPSEQPPIRMKVKLLAGEPTSYETDIQTLKDLIRLQDRFNGSLLIDFFHKKTKETLPTISIYDDYNYS